ncbi:hypothetical protein [Streptomyces sp. NPDC057579]|uniref:hypothetical protein n=1 Tax=Streptomyces sp. NPDC057579 TaxID=3346172 RepID=UPI003680AA2A
MASYDGKLHAVYPSAEGTDNLRHTTWTKDGGWTEPKDLVGHESKHTPALLTFKDGPAGSQREALLLVHRGVALYVRNGSRLSTTLGVGSSLVRMVNVDEFGSHRHLGLSEGGTESIRSGPERLIGSSR